MRIDVITPATVEPIDLTTAKLNARIDASDEDAIIVGLIAAARQSVEHEIGYALMTQTLRGTLDCFPRRQCQPWGWMDDAIVIRGVNVAVTSIKYTDTSNVEQTLDQSAYSADASGGDARITPAMNTCWPATLGPGAVRVTFTTGYAAPQNVPAAIGAAIQLIIADLYANREATMAASAVAANPQLQQMLSPFRRFGR